MEPQVDLHYRNRQVELIVRFAPPTRSISRIWGALAVVVLAILYYWVTRAADIDTAFILSMIDFRA